MQDKEILGSTNNRPLEFPQLGGAYDSFSRLLFTTVKGSLTYKKRLQRYTARLFTHLLRLSKDSGIEIRCSREQGIKALELLIHSIAHIASIPDKHRYISLSLNRNDYFGSKAQFAELHYKGVVVVVELLSNCFVEGNQTYVDRKNGHRNSETNSGLRTRLQPTGPFLDELARNDLIFAGHPSGLNKRNPSHAEQKALLQITKKDKKDNDKVVSNLDRALNDDELVLEALNVRLKRLRVDFKLPDYKAYTDNWNYALVKSKLAHMSGNQLYRRFADKDGSAGRLYGHWVQHCPSKFRQYLTFDTKETVELDYSSMQLTLLYGMANLTPPEGDLYAFGTIDRYWMKAVLTKSVGARSKIEALAALRKDMKETAPAMMNKATELFDLFWDRHADVYKFLFNDEGWKRLQYLDSIIALRVLRILLEQDIVCIPIHDSFIVKEQYSDQTESAMIEAFKSVFPHLKPSLK